jgi:hypothetical protein
MVTAFELRRVAAEAADAAAAQFVDPSRLPRADERLSPGGRHRCGR